MSETFKFIHASDFHLDEPMSGLAELPNHLKSILANAPYAAAENVFDLAINERVDFVLLAGDLFNMDTAGPRSAAFLLNQFRRLDEKGITVYWCSGSVDQPERWPSSIELPENVVTFSSGVVEQVEHRRSGAGGEKILATIFGTGYDGNRRPPAEFECDVNDPFPIALMYGEADATAFQAENIRYWAMGGRHKSNKLEKTSSIVSYSGSPQGRSPKESGVHGCKICRVDNAGKLRIQEVETDSVRWLPQKIAIEDSVNVTELKDVLGERAMKIAADTDITILINWYLGTNGEMNPLIRDRSRTDELLEWLRDEFGRSDRGIWSVKLTVEPPSKLPAGWYEEDTILGEFLRAVGRYQSDDSIKISLHDYLPNSVESEIMAGISQVSKDRRNEILRRAALTGIEYLGAHREPVQPIDAG